MVKRDLFETVRLVRYRGCIGAMQGRELAQDFLTEEEATEALERLAAVKRRQGYRDCERLLLKLLLQSGPVAHGSIE